MKKNISYTHDNYPLWLWTLVYNVKSTLNNTETLNKDITQELIWLIEPFEDTKLERTHRHHIINSLALLQSIIEMQERWKMTEERYTYAYKQIDDHFKALDNNEQL